MTASLSLHLLTAALAVALCGACTPRPPAGWSGYAEGEYIYVAAPVAGRLVTMPVQRGQRIDAGAPLFALDAPAERAGRGEAAARLVAAQAQAADADKGRRSDEIAVTRAQVAQARAQAELAAAELAREQQLVDRGFTSPARLDDLRTAARQSAARVAEAEAALRVAELPARPDARTAAQATASAASAALTAAAWRAGEERQAAPVAAEVADTFFRIGEWVPAGQPVVALLPPQGTRVRFYVAERELPALRVGQTVRVGCEGCDAAGVPARVERIATQPEYTPPVLYSRDQRSRLVFMVEARPLPEAAGRLRPGQPVDVQRSAGG